MGQATPQEHACSPVCWFVNLRTAEVCPQLCEAGTEQMMVVFFNESGGHGHYWCEVSAGEMIFLYRYCGRAVRLPFVYHQKNANDVSGWPRYIPGDRVTVDEHVRITLSGGIR
nr:hypothetical protein [Escherichia coli]